MRARAVRLVRPRRVRVLLRVEVAGLPGLVRPADRDQLALAGLPEEAVERVLSLVDRAEYKRRQAPPGIKITPRAFGRDRRMPITNAYLPRPRTPLPR